MDVFDELGTFLSSEDILDISNSVKTKICRHIENLRRNLNRIDEDYVKLSKDKEEREHSLSSDLRCMERDIEHNSQLRTEQMSTISKLQEQLVTVTEQCRQAEQLATSADAEKHGLCRQLEQLRSEQLQLVDQLNRRARDHERLAADMEDLRQQLADADRDKCQALLRVQEIVSKESSMQFRERRMELDKDLLQRQLDSVNEQLKENTELLVTKRREAASTSMELQLLLSKTQDELESTREERERLKVANTDLETRLAELMEKHRQQRDSELELEQNYQQQLASQTRLAKLYKDNAELAEARAEETAAAVHELRQLLSSSDSGQQQLREQLKQLARKHADQLAERDASSAQLQRQLDVCEQNLQEMVKRGGLSDEAIEELAPSAASVSRVLSSGLSLTQIFGRMCSAEDGEAAARAETQQLQDSMRIMVADIEKRAVQVRQLRDDYQAALNTIETLKESGDKVSEALAVVREESADWREQISILTAEKGRLSAQCADLSAQVCLLMAELEEARGGVVSRSDQDFGNNDSCADLETSSEQLITSRLVTFRSIEQLQRRNQQLLAVVRELSGPQQQPDRQQDAPEQQTQEEIESLRLQLKELQEARLREVSLVDSLVRQRDLYRSLVKGHEVTNQESMHESSAGDTISNGSVDTLAAPDAPRIQQGEEERVKLLKQQISELRDEYDFYKSEQKENAKVLEEQLEQHKQLLSEHRVRNVKLSSRLEYNDQRFGIVSANCEQYRRQVAALEEKYKQTAAINAKYEETIAALRENALSLQERVSRAEVRADHQQQQLSVCRQAEAQLTAERDLLRREATSSALLLSSIEHIKNNLDQAQTNATMNYQNQVDTLKREVSTWQTKCEQDSSSHRQTVSTMEEELKSLRCNAVSLESTISELEQKLEQQELRAQQMNEELEKLRSAPTPRSLPTDSTLAELAEVRKLHQQLASCRQQLHVVTGKLEAADNRFKQQQSIAEAAESRLADADRSVIECQTALQQQLSEKEEAGMVLSKQLAETRARCERLEQQMEKGSEEKGSISDVLQQMHQLKSQAQSSERQLKEVEERLQETLTSCKEENRHRLEAEERYQREVCQHAEDLQLLTACRESLASVKASVAEATESRVAAETRLSEQQQHWSRLQTDFDQQRAVAATEHQQLRDQNSLLLEQLDQLGQQLTAAHDRLHAAPAAQHTPDADTSFSERDATSSAQLLEVVGYLRRQRELSEAGVLTLQAEVERQRSELRVQQRRLHELQQLVDQHETDRSGDTAALHSTAQHSQLLRKLETLSAVTDSNRLLRREHTQLTQRCQELEHSLQETRTQLQPLKEENSQLQGRSVELEDTLATVRAERDRWQQRTNQLTERATKISPEELQQLQKDKEEMEKVNVDLRKRADTGQTELTAARQQLNKSTAELQLTATQLDKLKQTYKRLEGQLNAGRSDLSQLRSENTQLKQTNERLEGQLTTARTDLSQLRSENTQLKQQNVLVQKKCKEMSEHAEMREKQSDKLREEMSRITAESAEKQTKLSELQTSNMKLKTIGRKYKTQFEQLQSESQSLRQQLSVTTSAESATGSNQLSSELEQLKTSSKQLEEKNKLLTTQLRQKLLQLTAENKQLKERSSATSEDSADLEMRMDVMKSQYTVRLAALEKSLAEARNLGQQHESACLTLRRRLAALEKHLNTNQGKAVSTSRSVEDSGAATAAIISPSSAIISPSSARTPTANIRPMTPCPVSCVSGTAQSRATPTASIRPMKPVCGGRAAPTRTQQMTAETSTSISVATVSPTPASPSLQQNSSLPGPVREDRVSAEDQDLSSAASDSTAAASDSSVVVSAVPPLVVSASDADMPSLSVVHERSQLDSLPGANIQPFSSDTPPADSAQSATPPADSAQFVTPVGASSSNVDDTRNPADDTPVSSVNTLVSSGSTVVSCESTDVSSALTDESTLVSSVETPVSSGNTPVSSVENPVSSGNTSVLSVEPIKSSGSTVVSSVETAISSGSTLDLAVGTISSGSTVVSSAETAVSSIREECTVGDASFSVELSAGGGPVSAVTVGSVKRAADHVASFNDQSKRARCEQPASTEAADDKQCESNDDEVICLDSDEEHKVDSEGMDVSEAEEEEVEEEEDDESGNSVSEDEADDPDMDRERSEDNQESTEEVDTEPSAGSSEQICDNDSTDSKSISKTDSTQQQQQSQTGTNADSSRACVPSPGEHPSPSITRGRSGHTGSSRRALLARPGRRASSDRQRPQPIVWTPQVGGQTPPSRGFRQLQRARRARGARSFTPSR